MWPANASDSDVSCEAKSKTKKSKLFRRGDPTNRLDASPDASGEREVVADFQLPIVDLIRVAASTLTFDGSLSLTWI
jgi:hypothetical protein